MAILVTCLGLALIVMVLNKALAHYLRQKNHQDLVRTIKTWTWAEEIKRPPFMFFVILIVIFSVSKLESLEAARYFLWAVLAYIAFRFLHAAFRKFKTDRLAEAFAVLSVAALFYMASLLLFHRDTLFIYLLP